MRRALLAAAAALSVAACAVPPTTAATASTDAAATDVTASGSTPATPRARPAAPAADPVAAALAAADRPADAAAQDEGRQSAAIMAFAQIEPGDRVLDLGAFSGYSSWIISGIVGPEGAVVAQNPADWTGAAPVGPGMTALTAARQNVTYSVMPFDALEGDTGSFDVVFSGLIYHDTAYMDVDRSLMNRRIYELLKPGGRYIVIDHRAAPGSITRDVQTLHRIDAARVRREIENVGFTLDAESDVLTRAEDDFTLNVFDDAIRGRTSQFAYRFVRP